MFRKVLIANRGAIACRIIRTLNTMGVASVAVYSEADRHAMHVLEAGEAVAIGPSPAAESYLKFDAILDAARKTGAEAIHPGYGFLSENPDFADACEDAGIVFIGPKARHMRAFGLKHKARELALQANVPLAPGSGLISDVAHAMSEASRIGYPVMLKSTAGGGGIGLQLVSSAEEIAPMFERVERLARNNFKDTGIFIEKYVARGRHIEVQIFGDGQGTCRFARRARLLGAAAQPEGHRRDARSQSARADPLRALGHGAAARPVGQLRERRHGRVSLRRRDGRILFSRGQHASPGRARRDRRSHRRRSRRMDGATGGGRSFAPGAERHKASSVHRSRSASMRKIRAATSVQAPAG